MVEVYAGLDVSDKSTHVCVTDIKGVVLWAGACATDPEVIARTLRTRNFVDSVVNCAGSASCRELTALTHDPRPQRPECLGR